MSDETEIGDGGATPRRRDVPEAMKSHQFRPGQSGNPGGRTPGRSITARLRALLDRGEINGKPVKDGKQVADMLAEVVLKGALKGDFRFAKEILDRVDGKVPDRVEHSGGDGGPIVFGHSSLGVADEEIQAWRKKMSEGLSIERPSST